MTEKNCVTLCLPSAQTLELRTRRDIYTKLAQDREETIPSETNASLGQQPGYITRKAMLPGYADEATRGGGVQRSPALVVSAIHVSPVTD